MINNSLILFLLLTTTIVISERSTNDEISAIINEKPVKKNVTCLCIDDTICNSDTNVCTLTKEHHRCYQSWRLESTGGGIRLNAGCLYNDDFFVHLFCSGNDSRNYVVCCSQTDYCNDLDAYSEGIRRRLTTQLEGDHRKEPTQKKNISWLITGLVVMIALLLSIIIIAAVYYRKTKHSEKSKVQSNYNNETTSKNLLHNFSLCFGKKDDENIREGETLTRLLDDYSTSSMGNALPLLIQRTLAREIALGERIGAGRYGNVYRGTWRADNVAVKIFSANDERSWFREIDIYQTNCLRHDYILGFIAADNKDAYTHTQLWLVTEYHENGSVYDYLMNHTITVPILVKMMLSIASGLCHLHMPIDSTNGKVGLAHRDLKTKNILVKKDLSCCIADLGLAVKEVRSAPKARLTWANNKKSTERQAVIDIQPNPRVGTHRYMAPEVLDGTINMHNFESFKAADMYALGLAFWEMIRRCQTSSLENDAEDYQVPYEDMLPSNPSFEEIRDVVCNRKIRPTMSQRSRSHSILQSITRICEELWIEDPTCRLSALNVKTQLKVLSETVEQDLSNINAASQQQTTQNGGPWTA